MNPTSGNCAIEWLTPGPALEWLEVTVEVAEPSPAARICYTATDQAMAHPGTGEHHG